MDGMLRKITPVVLILLGLLVWLAPLVKTDSGVLRFVVGVLCLYTALLVFERQRMELRFTQVMGSFKKFYADRAAATESLDPEKGLEAVTILLAALDSPDEIVRQTAHDNLKRLTGKDFGSDPNSWAGWLEEARRTAGQGGPETP